MKTIKYGLWTVLNQEKIYIDKRVYLSCRCSCGTVRNVIIKNLKSGISKSCGCIRIKKTIKRNTVHGKRYTREWRIWQAIKTRCSNKNVSGYKNYGGRGIKVCDEWKNSFMSFYNYMGKSPKNYSIDRINNNGNYEPGNVKWSSRKEQSRNRRSNRRINNLLITDISRSLGGGDSLVYKRLKRGWSIKKAINTKSNARL